MDVAVLGGLMVALLGAPPGMLAVLLRRGFGDGWPRIADRRDVRPGGGLA